MLEYCPENLERILKRNQRERRLNFLQKLQMARDIAMGMDWLHAICKMSHGDLKPDNILADAQGNLKVVYFQINSLKIIVPGGRFRDGCSSKRVRKTF